MKIDINKYEELFITDYENGDFERELTRYRKKKLLEILSKYKTDCMLEIGCGMEPFFLDFDDYNKMIVVEAGPRMAARARALAGNAEDIVVIDGFVEDNIDLLKKVHFDIIMLVGLIHEVKDLNALMVAVAQLCDENTFLIITSNNPYSLHLSLAYEAGIISNIGVLTDKAKMYQRNRVFTLKDMKSLAEEYCMHVVEEGSYFIKPFSHGQMKQMLDEGIIDNEVLNGLDKMVKYIPEFGAENYIVVKKHEGCRGENF